MKFKCTATHTEADSGKERVVHTHTALLAKRRLVSKAAPPVAITSLSKMQRRLLSAENSYFKLHYLRIIIVCEFIHFSKKGMFGVYHRKLCTLRRRPTKFSEYLRMSIDTSDYILSKVHDSLENQPIKSTVKDRRRI